MAFGSNILKYTPSRNQQRRQHINNNVQPTNATPCIYILTQHRYIWYQIPSSCGHHVVYLIAFCDSWLRKINVLKYMACGLISRSTENNAMARTIFYGVRRRVLWEQRMVLVRRVQSLLVRVTCTGNVPKPSLQHSNGLLCRQCTQPVWSMPPAEHPPINM